MSASTFQPLSAFPPVVARGSAVPAASARPGARPGARPVARPGSGPAAGPAVTPAGGAPGSAPGSAAAGAAGSAAGSAAGPAAVHDAAAFAGSAPQDATPVSFRSVRRASPEIHAARASGYASGYAAGWSAATREVRVDEEARIRAQEDLEARAAAEAERVRSALAMARETARSMASPVLQTTADDLASAAVALAEQLVGVVLRDERLRVHGALARALEIEEESGAVRVRMNPDDVEIMRAMLSDPAAEIEIPEGVDVQGDPSLARGDAVTELEVGFVDARLSSALTRVRAELELVEYDADGAHANVSKGLR